MELLDSFLSCKLKSWPSTEKENYSQPYLTALPRQILYEWKMIFLVTPLKIHRQDKLLYSLLYHLFLKWRAVAMFGMVVLVIAYYFICRIFKDFPCPVKKFQLVFSQLTKFRNIGSRTIWKHAFHLDFIWIFF